MPNAKAIIIAGATASGKSDLAIRLASRMGAQIVNADSVQLYRDLPILTASPNDTEKAQVPHFLYNVLEPEVPATAALWLDHVQLHRARDDTPMILVGGTGLYIKSLIEGLAPVPEVDPAVRNAIRTMDRDACRTALEAEDPIMASRLKPRDQQRNMRALEVIRSTGTSLSVWQQMTPRQSARPLRYMGFSLLPDRALLRERIHDRMQRMVQMGALDEVADLRKRVGDPLKLPISKAHGLLELCQLLDGEIDEQTAISRTALRVGQYAKRQSTFFRGQLSGFSTIEHLGDDPRVLETIMTAVRDGDWQQIATTTTPSE